MKDIPSTKHLYSGKCAVMVAAVSYMPHLPCLLMASHYPIEQLACIMRIHRTKKRQHRQMLDKQWAVLHEENSEL